MVFFCPRERTDVKTHFEPSDNRRIVPPELLLDPGRRSTGVVACSLCLRVLHDGRWTAAEKMIRQLRSYELPQPLSLRPGLCDGCSDALSARRGREAAHRAAERLVRARAGDTVKEATSHQGGTMHYVNGLGHVLHPLMAPAAAGGSMAGE
jgi:hypothetical protein